ncbi:HAD domain-containing protein [Nocardioides plantarum]|uniref:HAD domain-containing protein n=1 Tax=Nocardioides plantarum TaxID=29299 RepID=A0ABV5KER0_9ACTN|nr:HAD domain-containing protein [Nocardioides plantarum]
MPTSADQPVIFLDVDGPLIPFGASGYPTFGSGFDNPLLERVDPSWGRQLSDLPGELVWATTWEEEANEVLGPLLGLAPLPVVVWPDGDVAWVPPGGHWKTEALLSWSKGRALVWIDDEISDADRSWIEENRTEPSYLLRVDHRVGLTRTDLTALEAWLLRVSC